MLSKEDMLKMVAGMEPVKLFIRNDNIFRLRRWLNVFGISPINWLLPRYSSSSFDKLQMASGMLPTNLLLNKFSFWSSLHLPKIKEKKIAILLFCRLCLVQKSIKEKNILRENNFLWFSIKNKKKIKYN